MRPDSTGVYFNPDQPADILRTRFPDIVTLPQHFKNHGYTTHPLHKVFDGRTVDSGHDSISWTLPYGPWEMAPGEKPAPGGYQNPATKAMLAEASAQGRAATGPATEACNIPDTAYHDGGVAATAVKRIREFAKSGQPFFLAVGFVKPHLPFIAPKKYWDFYQRTELPLARFQSLPAGSQHGLDFYGHSGELRGYADILKSGPIPEALQRELIHGYAACVSYIDAQVGLLLEALRQEGVDEKTVICIWGDHGWHLGDHGHWGKLTNYEDAARAPLLIAAPGCPGGVRTGALTELVDLYPTLCELAGLPVPSHVQGRSLAPLMQGEKVSPHEVAVTQMARGTGADALMGWSVRTQRYRYTEWRRAKLDAERAQFGNGIESIEFYDYQDDPLERENLSARQGYEHLIGEHQALFDRVLAHLPKRPR